MWKAKVAGIKKTTSAHPPSAKEAKAAQDVAVAPPNDQEAQAKAAKADAMGEAKPGGFDKAAFIAAVKAAIDAQAPKTSTRRTSSPPPASRTPSRPR